MSVMTKMSGGRFKICPNSLRRKGGAAAITSLFWLFIVACVIYLGVKFAPPYITYYMFKLDVEGEAARANMYSDAEILKHLREKVASYELPVTDEDIVMDRRDTEMEVTVNYETRVTFFDRYAKNFKFHIRTVKPIKIKQ